MKNTLIVLADLGCLKAFRVDGGDQLSRTPRLELLEQYENPEAHGKLVDKVTDLSGRFPRATGSPAGGGAMSDGERHNINLEMRKRLVRQLATRVNQLVGKPEVERCMLAASREINNQLIAELEPHVRAKILKNLTADLTKIERAQILGRF